MLILVLWIVCVMGFLAHMENPKRDINREIKHMIREARYHEAHPETKRSVKYMNAGYYNN